MARGGGAAERERIIAERGPRKPGLGKTGGKAGLLTLLRSRPALWGLALAQGCNVCSQYRFLSWLPSYPQNKKDLSLAKTGLFAAIPCSVAVVLCILIGLTSDRLLRDEVGGGSGGV